VAVTDREAAGLPVLQVAPAVLAAVVLVHRAGRVAPVIRLPQAPRRAIVAKWATTDGAVAAVEQDRLAALAHKAAVEMAPHQRLADRL